MCWAQQHLSSFTFDFSQKSGRREAYVWTRRCHLGCSGQFLTGRFVRTAFEKAQFVANVLKKKIGVNWPLLILVRNYVKKETPLDKSGVMWCDQRTVHCNINIHNIMYPYSSSLLWPHAISPLHCLKFDMLKIVNLSFYVPTTIQHKVMPFCVMQQWMSTCYWYMCIYILLKICVQNYYVSFNHFFDNTTTM